MADERGLVGKLLVVWLVLLAVLVIGAIDAGSIVLTTIKASSAADKAAVRGATVFHLEDTRGEALDAALQQLEEDMPNAKLDPEDFAIDPPSGRVSVRITAKAPTLLVGRISFLRHYTKITETSTAHPPE
jgi:hypothetical protein